jgi:fatty acid desaturase
MTVTPLKKPEPKQRRERRHLHLVPHPARPASDEERRVSETRWMATFIAVAMLALNALWWAAALGAAGSAWWPFVFAAVAVAVFALGIEALRHIG